MKEEYVVLVDRDDNPVGTAPKMEAHRQGLLHRAFSVFLFDDEGRLILQRRAGEKYHSGGLWTNTVCSHPRPGETINHAARRRLREEMGIDTPVRKIFDFVYRAELDQGLTEHEFDHVFVGQYSGEVCPDPAEAEAVDYKYLQEIREDLRRHPERYTEWFKIIFDKSFDTLMREAGKMYRNRPLIWEPYYEPKIWGGRRLESLFDKQLPSGKIGESWEVSAVPQKESRVKSGFFKGFDLRELWKILGPDFFGDLNEEVFPLLIKYIDAADDLSVQVHPDDELARRLHGGKGKNETWYVLDAASGSRLYLGFKSGVTQKDFSEALKKGQVEKLLNAVPVRPGDWFYVPAGTVHAIGKNVLLAEIQQNSDLTYRIYDYNRKDANGNLRPLHLREAMQAVHFEARPRKVEGEILKTPYFEVHKTAPGKTVLPKEDTFTIIMNPFGDKMKINDSVLHKGETALLFSGGEFVVDSSAPWLWVKPVKRQNR